MRVCRITKDAEFVIAIMSCNVNFLSLKSFDLNQSKQIKSVIQE